jgi:hypothetical protein
LTAVETTKEGWWEAEINRIAGEIALMSPEPDAVKAEEYFKRSLAVAGKQQAKSWELRAAMSTARLWRDQGQRGPSFGRSRACGRFAKSQLRSPERLCRWRDRVPFYMRATLSPLVTRVGFAIG